MSEFEAVLPATAMLAGRHMVCKKHDTLEMRLILHLLLYISDDVLVHLDVTKSLHRGCQVFVNSRRELQTMSGHQLKKHKDSKAPVGLEV